MLRTISAVNLERRVFSTQFAGGYDRLFDSEAKFLKGFAETFKSTPNIIGGIKLHQKGISVYLVQEWSTNLKDVLQC